jgi:hypothetical protein
LFQIRTGGVLIRNRLLLCGLAAVCFLDASGPVFAAVTGLRTLRGHVPPVLAHLTPVGNLPATRQLNLAIGLPLRNHAELDELLRQLYDPASPNFHKFLTPEEFTARFGPTEADYAAVEDFARTNGLVVTGTYGNRLLLDVAGSSRAVENAFHVTLRTYRHPTENRDFFAPDAEPTVDAALPVVDVQGLSDFSRPHPKLHRVDAAGITARAATPNSGSGPVVNNVATYIGNDFRNAYMPASALNGSGQAVGLLQFDGFYASDITAYENLAGRTNIPLQTVLLDGFSGTPTTGANSGNDEVSLDIEMAMSMAPALAKIVLFEAGPNGVPNDILNSMVTFSNTVKNLSSSWGWSGGPTATTDNIFITMAAQGQSFFDASGDSDAFLPGTADAEAPSSSPYISQVGATTLTMNGTGASYASETVWNWNYDSAAGAYVGSSGGISTYYPIPLWQQGVNSFLTNGGSTTTRNIPDVAMVGDNVYVKYGNGTNGSFGGTSCAAPLWAGFMALVNQQAVAGGATNGIGFINPAVYEIANESIYNSAFNDITTGSNTWPSSPNSFYATPGYDLCTGLGTPAGTNLINALINPDPLVVVSNGGFNAIISPGGAINIAAQTFYLTNAGVSSLTWSLVNTSSWLNVSGGATLAVGAGDSVVANLNTVASNLPAGIYTANLGFSNVTSGVTHYRFFTLTVKDTLAILPTNNFIFDGIPGGPFNPTAQIITLTNTGSGVLNWSINNTSSWFNVSPNNGSLLSKAQTNVTITLAPAITNLPDGTYSAAFQVTNLASQFVQIITGRILVGRPPNGGFETGDFTAWTLTGDAGTDDYVTTGVSDVSPHSGTYFAALGEVSVQAYLSQMLPTSASQKYLLSLWLNNPLSATNSSGRRHPVIVTNNPNEFSVSWNGSTLYDKQNFGVLDWTNLQFVVTATGGSTVLQIGGRDDNSYLGLDDVSVTPVYAPAISTQPTNQTILAGSSAAFNVTIGGTPPLVYQWRKNGTNLVNGGNISGATTTVLTFTAGMTNNSGNYSVVITNVCGSITSAVATLTVTPVFAPTISIQPTNQTIFAGDSAAFNVTAGGTTPLIYQWSKNGNNIANGGNISGATTNVLTFTAATTNNNGNYTVVITNAYGSITSAVAMLTVNLLHPVIALASSENPSGFKDSLNFTAAMTPASTTGSVQFFTNGILFDSESLAAGSAASVFTASLPRGTNLITAIYSGDANDLAATNSLAQIVTNHPPVAEDYFTKRFAGLPLKIPVANLSSNWSDADGDTVSLAAIGVSTNGVTVTNNAGTLVYCNSNNVDDKFTCTITDGWGGTNFQNVYLTVLPLPGDAVLAISSLVVSGGNSIFLNLAGAPGFTYVLETTANLTAPGSWLPVVTNVVGTNGVWQFSGGITNNPQQFYRLQLVQ